MKFSLEPIDENALYLTVGTVVTEELWVAIAKRIEAIARVRELLSNLAVDEDGCVIPRDKEQLIKLFNQALEGDDE